MKYFLLTALFVSLSFLSFLGFLLGFLSSPPVQKQATVEVKVERGESFSSVVRKLKDKGVISNEKLFSLWARLSDVDKKIHWGLYRFEMPLAPKEILNRMVLGKGVFHRITIPEGLTLKEIADHLQKGEIAKKDQFLAEANSPELLSLLGLEGKGIEGYLFPETYYFTPLITEREILMTMAEKFRGIFSPMMEKQAKEVGLNLHEVVTLASLIEKETGIEAERPLVSAVFHNRLKSKIPLQSDPTVIYGLKHFTGNLKRKDLRTHSPYNTYLIQGLPPGPICNPGLSSLMATLHPAPVPYLYFVSKNDGSHLFSVSLEEHNKAVKLYQSGKQRLPRR